MMPISTHHPHFNTPRSLHTKQGWLLLIQPLQPAYSIGSLGVICVAMSLSSLQEGAIFCSTIAKYTGTVYFV